MAICDTPAGYISGCKHYPIERPADVDGQMQALVEAVKVSAGETVKGDQA
jgi:hypothetical protein